MTLEHVGGQGKLTTLYEQSLMVAVYEDFILDDFVLEVDLLFTEPGTGAKAGIAFHTDDPESGMDYYYLVMVAPVEEKIVLATFHETEWLRWDLIDIPSNLVSSTNAYHLGIDCLGDRIAVHLDDTEVARIEDSANPDPGLFGLAIAGYVIPESATFDDLLIIEHP